MEFRGGLAGGGGLGRSWRDRRAERRGRRAGLRLGMERLEERVVLSTFTWKGTDASAPTPNNNWSDANNWTTDSTTRTVPGAGDTLVFPTGPTGAALTSNDDIALSNASFAGLTIQAAGYVITGGTGITAPLSGPIEASQASGSSTLNLPVDFGTSPGSVSVDHDGATLVMSSIAGTVGMTSQGPGTLNLTGTSTLTGGTIVAAGTLLVDGGLGDVQLSPASGSSATVGGKGTVASITSVGGTVSPGDSSTATGTLTDTGALTLDAGSAFDVTINGTTPGDDYDQLNAGSPTGPVSLGGAALNVALGSLATYSPQPGDQFTILHNTSGGAIAGQFNGLAEGAYFSVSGYDFRITYAGGTGGQDVVLTAVDPHTVPSLVDTWTGGGATNNWSDPGNWDNGVPAAGDALVFPSGLSGAALSSNDDITSNPTFYSLSIADGYTITASPNAAIGLATSIGASLSASATPPAATVGVPITFNPGTGAGTVTVDNAGASLVLGGAVAAPSGLTKQGAGALNLAGNDGALPVTVGQGTLLVDGTAGAITVNSGATLGGTGTVASITTAASTVSPGDSPTATGALTVTGPVTLDAHATFAVTLVQPSGSTTYDQLIGSGPINLAGAALDLTLGTPAPAVGQSFTIVHNNGGAAITGTFAGLANGSVIAAGGVDFAISYQGGSTGRDVVLTAVSPPVFTWTGADAATSGNWSDGGNWAGGTAPTGQADETLVFPAGLSGPALTSNDDINGGSFGAILIQGSGYTIASTQGYGVTLTGATPIDASYGSGSATFNLPVDLGGNAATFTVDNQAAGLKMGGVVTNAAGVTKAGAGVLALQANNTYTGSTTIAAGALLVDGAVVSTGGVAVGPGATLGGTGTVPSIDATSTGSSSGIVSPGDSPTITGILTDQGDLNLDANSTFAVDINGTTVGTNYDQLKVGGAINLGNATLSISTGAFNPVPGQTYTIIQHTGTGSITGTFKGLAEGATIAASGHVFSISYAGNDVVLTAATPPSFTWSGGDALVNPANNGWSDPNNWNEHAVPGPGAKLTFPAGLASGALNSNNDIDGTTFFSIIVQAGGYVISGKAIGLAGPIDASQSGSGSATTSTISLPITFNPGAGSVTVDNAGASLLLSGVVTASSGLSKQGQGTLALSANNGTTAVIVGAGTLLVDGAAGNISVNSGATLGGIGTVGAITTTAATLSPGDSSTATGILTDNGNLVLDSASKFVVTLNGATPGPSGYDQVVVGGTGNTINLNNATLSVSIGSSFPTGGGQQFTILSNPNNAALTGTFAGLAEGGTLTVASTQFKITYQGGTGGHDVVLTSLVPSKTTVSPVTTQPVSGQSVTLQATVQPSSGSGIPTGSVSFSATINGATVSLGTAQLDSTGTATLTTTKLTAGTDQVTATYAGDGTYGTSTSPTIAVVVGKAATSSTLTISPNPSVVGQLVALTATISAVAPGSGTPTGSVTFFNGTTNLGSASLAAGVAVLNTAALPVGSDSITAVYSGDTSFTTVTSSAVVAVVNQGGASVSISTSDTNPFALSPITLTAIVSLGSGTGTPTGTVTFQTSDGTTLGTATLSSGQATLTTNSLLIGPQTITAVYSGNATFQSATSPGLPVVVGHPNDLYVNQIYLDVFGIPASYNATYWIALLNAGYGRRFVSRQILRSKGARTAAVENVYGSLLQRPATPGELHRALRSGNTSTTPLYARVFGSREFFLTQGQGTNDGWLTSLANDWFGAPFPGSVQASLARKLARGTPRAQVARQVISSPSGVRAEVNTIVEGVLGRPADAADQRRFAPLVRRGNMVAVYQTLFTSNEFITKYVKLQ